VARHSSARANKTILIAQGFPLPRAILQLSHETRATFHARIARKRAEWFEAMHHVLSRSVDLQTATRTNNSQAGQVPPKACASGPAESLPLIRDIGQPGAVVAPRCRAQICLISHGRGPATLRIIIQAPLRPLHQSGHCNSVGFARTNRYPRLWFSPTMVAFRIRQFVTIRLKPRKLHM